MKPCGTRTAVLSSLRSRVRGSRWSRRRRRGRFGSRWRQGRRRANLGKLNLGLDVWIDCREGNEHARDLFKKSYLMALRSVARNHWRCCAISGDSAASSAAGGCLKMYSLGLDISIVGALCVDDLVLCEFE